MKTRVYLKDVESFCRLGIYDHERDRGQCINATIIVEFDGYQACVGNDINGTVNYVELSLLFQETCQEKEYWLIENLSQTIISRIFDKWPKVDAVDIHINKPVINSDGFSGNASVRVVESREEYEALK